MGVEVKEFKKEHKLHKPLNDALEWRAAGVGRYLVAEERFYPTKGRVGRVYLGFNSFAEFFDWYYTELKPELRHIHEIIPEDEHCRLALDLEYYVHCNKDKDATAMLELALQLIVEQLDAQFEVEIRPQRDIVVLNSSNEKKMSYHVVVDTPGFLWTSWIHCLVFVRSVLDEADERYHGQLDVIDDKTGNLTSFVDTQIYKNRTFRMYMSTKYGDTRYLRTESERQAQKTKPDYTTLLRALVLPHDVKPGSYELLDCEDDLGDYVAHHRNGVKKRKLQSASDANKRLKLGDQHNVPDFCRDELRELLFGDMEMQKVMMSEDPLDFMVTYITLSKQCEIAGREHVGAGSDAGTGNNVYYLVFLKKKTYVQKCFSPDCVGKVSARHRIPDENGAHKLIDDYVESIVGKPGEEKNLCDARFLFSYLPPAERQTKNQDTD